MIADIILGNNIDTNLWISDLTNQGSDEIIVVDYDYFGEPYRLGNVLYVASIEAKKYIYKFDAINFYKSLYAYPGMNGSMSSLYKRR